MSDEIPPVRVDEGTAKGADMGVGKRAWVEVVSVAGQTVFQAVRSMNKLS